MNIGRKLLFLMLLVTSSLAGAASTLAIAPEKEMEGTIQELDFGANTMIFQGLSFRMAPELTVEIRGSHGAFTMLQEGMKAHVTYRVLSASEREAVRIEQLPDNYSLEGA